MLKTSNILWQDAQHQVLFEILDLIREPDTGGDVILRLRDYTENHFALEELYMRRTHYPGLEEHVRAHDRFRSELEELLGDREPDALDREIISTFLTEWLKRHVFGIDKQLEEFLEAGEQK
ncbi:MAG: hemerythrin family protein [Halioglobus sp.]|nr:hemerythrin family protein [Halioglobus sp.]